MENLRRLRKIKGYTCESLGKLVGVQKSAISKYERNEIQPSREVLVNLADILDTTTDYLLEKTNDPSPLSEKESQKKDITVEEFLTANGIEDMELTQSIQTILELAKKVKNNKNLNTEFANEFLKRDYAAK